MGGWSGGVILCPDGKVWKKFTMGLGVTKNNHAEELGLWKGLRLALVEGVSNLSIFCDSLVTINRCINCSKSEDHDLSPTMQIIILLMDKFED